MSKESKVMNKNRNKNFRNRNKWNRGYRNRNTNNRSSRESIVSYFPKQRTKMSKKLIEIKDPDSDKEIIKMRVLDKDSSF